MTTTNTSTVGTGGDYTTIASWEADTDNNLLGDGAGSDSIEVGALLNEDHDVSGFVPITGATTDTDHYRVLQAASGTRYDPVAGTGPRVVQVGDGPAFNIREEGLRVENVAAVLQGASLAAARDAVSVTGTDTTNSNSVPVRLTNVVAVIEASASDFGHDGFKLTASSSGLSVVCRNCLVLGRATGSSNFGNGFDIVPSAGATITLDNCGSYGTQVAGIVIGANLATMTMRNTWSIGAVAGNAFTFTGGTSSLTLASLASDDATAIGTGAVTGIVAADAFTAPASNDFTLKTGSVLIDAGVDLSAFFTTDLAGNLHGRNGTWDIGAYDFRGYPLTRIAQTFSITDREEATMHFTNREEATCRIS